MERNLKKRNLNILNTIFCFFLCLASAGFFMASAMSFATDKHLLAKFLAMLMTLGIPLITIISVVLFWSFQNKNKKIWIWASLAPWVYLLCYYWFVKFVVF